MKTSFVFCSLFLASATAFSPVPVRLSALATTTSRNMFGGAGGAGEPMDEEEEKKMEQTAKAMGMSLDEYKLGVNSRMKLNEELDNLRVVGGSDDIKVERDGHNPPKTMEVTITEAGKAKGQETLAKEIMAALKSSGDEAKKGRAEAQKNMMAFISEQLKGGKM